MKLELPLSFEDITISQVMKHGERQVSDFELLLIYTDHSADYLKGLPYQLIEKGARHIEFILENPQRVHHNIIEVDGKLYGFIPDWSEFTTGEYIDMEEWSKDLVNNATKVMHLLYRPITRQYKDKYEIEKYKGSTGHQEFGKVSAQEFYGALLFFSNTRKELAFSLAQSLAKETKQLLMRQSPPSGVGITLLYNLRKVISSKYNRLLNYLSRKS